MTDPIADYLTRLRNAIKSRHRVVEVPASNIKKEITKVLFDKGYILNYKFDQTENKQGMIKIALKYNPETKDSAISKIDRSALLVCASISRLTNCQRSSTAWASRSCLLQRELLQTKRHVPSMSVEKYCVTFI